MPVALVGSSLRIYDLTFSVDIRGIRKEIFSGTLLLT